MIENAFRYDFRPKAFIDLDELKRNMCEIRKRAGNARFYAVVKSDAYGHGACGIAAEAEPLCDGFAVASLSEALAIRVAGAEKPILCLLPVADVSRAAFSDVEISVADHDDFERICRASEDIPKKPALHFSVNTGMNRLGYDSLSLFERDLLSAKKNGFRVAGTFSHFFNSSDYETTLSQYKIFKKFGAVSKSIFPGSLLHICASGALSYGEFNCDMVRVGLLMYGYKPVIGTFDVKPIMNVYARSILCRDIKRGENVLYGDYKTDEDVAASVLFYGYYDGLETLARGVNDNCMNLCAVESNCEFKNVTKNLAALAEKTGGIYRTLLRAGRVCEKVCFHGAKS